VLFRDANVVPEGILDAEVARPPWTPTQLLDDAPRAPSDRIGGVDVAHRHDDLDAVAALRRSTEPSEVRMPTDRRRAAPKAQQRGASP
jgi:hypothetical protein